MQPLILVVDDEEVFLSVLEVTLGGRYSLLKARSAREALDLLDKHAVHLVISDVMMPGMDGYELCKRIKSNVDYSLIPVLLLTAKNTVDAKITGLELGADAYIEKPFSDELLQAQIASLLYNRNKVAEYFNASMDVLAKRLDQPGEEARFLKHLEQVIREHIQDVELDVNKLAEIMNMSRGSLYRKVKEASDVSPAELITMARLKKAVELMADGQYRVYEIADLVGFSSAGSLTMNFLRQFNMTPSEYARSRREGQ